MNGSPGPAYDLQRSTAAAPRGTSSSTTYTSEASLEDATSEATRSQLEYDYSSSINDRDSSVTAGANYLSYPDATETVHEMHLALLYLLSHPDEFTKALYAHPPRGTTTLSDWNAEYDDSATEVENEENANQSIPLPFVVFADDAEVVLPQAHTASQLFGIERTEGMELEAAAGVPALSQLFLRWLALMPGGDHLNIIDPPGLTVMRIAGGRYRVTAAHRVVWTWMNEFPLSDAYAQEHSDDPPLQVGDLVTLTIVDVFETDNHGKLLSYCPTFDNRAIKKTTQTRESWSKGSSQLVQKLTAAKKSPAALKVNQAAAKVTRLSISAAKSVADSVKSTVSEQLKTMQHGQKKDSNTMNAKGFEQALSEAEAKMEGANVSMD